MSDNLGNDAIHVAKYIEIRETQHTQAHIVQVSVTSRILRLALFRVVLTAINFDDQPRRGAIEINDSKSPWPPLLKGVWGISLTIELESMKLLPAKLRPQRNLRVGH